MPTMAPTRRRTESAGAAASSAGGYRGEQLTLRNHDHRSGYGLGVHVRDGSETVRHERYVVGSRTTKREFDLCPPGEYTVEVYHGGELADAVTVRLDDTPDATLVVECGNGAVSASVGRP